MKRSYQTDSIAQLDRDMAEKNLSGYWSLGMEGLPSEPMTPVQPCLWKWADVYQSLVRAGEVISLENSERRVVRLVNPGLNERPFSSHTLQASFQYVKPGENARAHRHTPAALRFVVQGHGAYTTVNGQQCVMEPGDLILTPNMSWHDHSNDSPEPMLWLDGLDFPLVTALHQVMQERYPTRRQSIEKSSDEVRRKHWKARCATDCRSKIYSTTDGPTPRKPCARRHARPRQKTLRRLSARIPQSAHRRTDDDDNPMRRPVACRRSNKPQSHRHTSTVIYHVFRGQGASQIGDQRFEWQQGDTFVVPLWQAHCHMNRSSSDEAILFSMSDAPVLKALGLYREEF